MKKIFLFGVILAAGLVLIGSQVLAGGKVTTDPRYPLTSATTSTVTLSPHDVASTTHKFSISGSESLDYNICTTPEAPTSKLVYELYFSPDNSTWFQETSASDNGSGLITHQPVSHELSLATTTTSYRCFNLLTQPVGSPFAMIKMGVVSATTTIWYSAIPQIGL